MSTNQTFWRVTDVAEFLQCSTNTAYRIMSKLNKEQKAKGYIVVAGRIPRALVIKRTCGEVIE